jgi:hypothetical protein
VPLLVIWGPGVAETLDHRPKLEGQTRVVAGTTADDWLERMAKAADRSDADLVAAAAIEELVAEASEAPKGASWGT